MIQRKSSCDPNEISFEFYPSTTNLAQGGEIIKFYMTLIPGAYRIPMRFVKIKAGSHKGSCGVLMRSSEI